MVYVDDVDVEVDDEWLFGDSYTKRCLNSVDS